MGIFNVKFTLSGINNVVKKFQSSADSNRKMQIKSMFSAIHQNDGFLEQKGEEMKAFQIGNLKIHTIEPSTSQTRPPSRVFMPFSKRYMLKY